jgi:hypothetical protein
VHLKDLAHFRIRSVRAIPNERLELEGDFTHLVGVRLAEQTDGTVGFLYLSQKNSVYLLRKEFDPDLKTATFLVWPPADAPRIGSSYPYVDYYWNPKQVSFALEPASAWRRVRFEAQDAVRYQDPAVPGWWTSHVAAKPPSKGATKVHVVKNGWDHEHCNLCRSRIGEAKARYGYFCKEGNDWLCVSCYRKFIAVHDLRFLQFKK